MVYMNAWRKVHCLSLPLTLANLRSEFISVVKSAVTSSQSFLTLSAGLPTHLYGLQGPRLHLASHSARQICRLSFEVHDGRATDTLGESESVAFGSALSHRASFYDKGVLKSLFGFWSNAQRLLLSLHSEINHSQKAFYILTVNKPLKIYKYEKKNHTWAQGNIFGAWLAMCKASKGVLSLRPLEISCLCSNSSLGSPFSRIQNPSFSYPWRRQSVPHLVREWN